MCEEVESHKTRELKALANQIKRHITRIDFVVDRPTVTATVRSRPGLNGEKPGEGDVLIGYGVAKVCYPDRWWPHRGKAVAFGKAVKRMAMVLRGDAEPQETEAVTTADGIERYAGGSLGSGMDIMLGEVTRDFLCEDGHTVLKEAYVDGWMAAHRSGPIETAEVGVPMEVGHVKVHPDSPIAKVTGASEVKLGGVADAIKGEMEQKL